MACGCVTNSPKIVELDDSNFRNTVLNEKKPLVVLFKAAYCNPCKEFAPRFESVASMKQFVDHVKFATVEITKSPETKVANGVRMFPSVLIFKAGEKVVHQVGRPYHPEDPSNEKNEKIVEMIQSVISNK